MNALNWFEIPSTDFTRAVKFYSTILGVQLEESTFHGMPMSIFPYQNPGVGGAIVFHTDMKPSFDGVTVYINTGKDLDAVLSRVEQAGGKIVMPKTDIGEPGYVALIVDSEGNRVGLHSFKA